MRAVGKSGMFVFHPFHPADPEENGDDDEGGRPDFDMDRFENGIEMSADEIEGDDPDEIEELQDDDAGEHPPKLAAPGSRKGSDGGAEKPGGLDGVAAPANMHAEAGGRNDDE